MNCVRQVGVDCRGRVWFWTNSEVRPREVLGVAAAGRRLKKSRRQVYRYLRAGILRPRAKFLGEWLLDAADVRRLAQTPSVGRPIPGRLQILFPEYDVSTLHAGKDRALILSRVLERGDRAELRWAFGLYRPREIVGFLREDGRRLLTAKGDRFWRLYFGLRLLERRPNRTGLDRDLGRALGGAG